MSLGITIILLQNKPKSTSETSCRDVWAWEAKRCRILHKSEGGGSAKIWLILELVSLIWLLLHSYEEAVQKRAPFLFSDPFYLCIAESRIQGLADSQRRRSCFVGPWPHAHLEAHLCLVTAEGTWVSESKEKEHMRKSASYNSIQTLKGSYYALLQTLYFGCPIIGLHVYWFFGENTSILILKLKMWKI